jgi:hypothetical protein
MTADDEFEQIEGQLRAAIALVFAPLAARGKATVAYEVDRMGCHRIQPSKPERAGVRGCPPGPG